MSTRIADRLAAARRAQFVGRAQERELVRAALTAGELPFQVLYTYGPGGVGKTSLLREFGFIAAEAGWKPIYLDTRNVDPSPNGFLFALSEALGMGELAPAIEQLTIRLSRCVLLIDTYETLMPLDGWVRERFLPEIPGDALVVMAGRHAPAPVWRADPAWQSLVRVVALRNLSPDEARALLDKRSVSAEQQTAVLDFTHGHPLALSLVADVFAQSGATRFVPEDAPDLVRTLLEHLVQEAPTAQHRAALEASAMVRLTGEPILADMLAIPDAREVFDWLRKLSFIDFDRQGIFPHDLAREALVADVRWRNPQWYLELHNRARAHLTRQLAQVPASDQPRLLYDLIYLHRYNPTVRPYFEWKEGGSIFTDMLRPGDEPALLAMVGRHEGDEAAAIARHWLARQPQNVTVLRDSTSTPVGLLVMVSLDKCSAEDARLDPAVDKALGFLKAHAPLRSGETATHFRFWMGADTYQQVSPAQTRIFLTMVQHYLSTPGLAYTFLPTADPAVWRDVFAYADLQRVADADYSTSGHRLGPYGHDWRAVPPLAWLALLGEREVTGAPSAQAPQPPASAEQLIVLSEQDFHSAVHAFLKDFARPTVLRANPLLRSRLVADKVGLTSDFAKRLAHLQTCVRAALEPMKNSPRDAKLHRAVHHTYMQPAETQERAAELLNLPFSTYRRHLKEGVERVAEALWLQEVGLG